ncbi:MAG: peptidoglycan binding protein CsiV [gamma proteobacterium symbiont of Bathyaustriella thionipta]|nr:peptidoglycan binding protein CsiV [gamma proteobacterium symbiont of Bathyaustriella thionipta]
MKLIRLKQLAISLVLLGLCNGLAAQGEPRLYDIELIIFQYAGNDAGADEYWPEDFAKPDYSQAGILPKQSVNGYKRLSQASFQLNTTDLYLRSQPGKYPVLVHMAWRQPASDNGGKKIFISGKDDVADLQGTVAVSIKRFLHVDLDLLLNTSPGNRPLLQSNSQNSELPEGFSSTSRGQQSYHIISHRKMRRDELHYIDHPLLGVLVIAHRYEPDA